jgi:hypothetical protein
MKMKKRGQVAIFVVIAIVIIVAVLLVYFLVPQAKTVFSGELVPNNYLQSCVQTDLEKDIKLLSDQGGYENPEGYTLYQGNKIKYLCYTSQFYLPCKVQQPLIVRNFELELQRITREKTVACVNQMVQEFKNRGYNVNVEKPATTNVEMVPENIKISIDVPITISKDSTQRFNNFEFDIPSKMYNLVMISTSIVGFESTYGNTDTDVFTAYYPNVDIDKIERDDGTTIFVVKDVTSKETFRFASRSLAWPGGYGMKA